VSADLKRLVTNAWIYRIQACKAGGDEKAPAMLPVTHDERMLLRAYLPSDAFDNRDPYSVMTAMGVRVVSLDPLDHLNLTKEGARQIIDDAMEDNGFKPGEVPKWVFDAVMAAGRRS
jgi:hypothetical protein